MDSWHRFKHVVFAFATIKQQLNQINMKLKCFLQEWGVRLTKVIRPVAVIRISIWCASSDYKWIEVNDGTTGTELGHFAESMHMIGTVRVCLFVYNGNFHMNIQCFKLGVTLVR